MLDVLEITFEIRHDGLCVSIDSQLELSGLSAEKLPGLVRVAGHPNPGEGIPFLIKRTGFQFSFHPDHA